MSQSTNEQDKVLLSVIAMCFGLLVFVLYWTANAETELNGARLLVGLVLGLAGALAYALTGAMVVALCVKLRDWAYQSKSTPLTVREKLRLAAFWPFTLITSLVNYFFLGVINRFF